MSVIYVKLFRLFLKSHESKEVLLVVMALKKSPDLLQIFPGR